MEQLLNNSMDALIEAALDLTDELVDEMAAKAGQLGADLFDRLMPTWLPEALAKVAARWEAASEAAEAVEVAQDVGTGGEETSLEAAERLALTWHRLRKALRLLHETPEAKLAQLMATAEEDAARPFLPPSSPCGDASHSIDENSWDLFFDNNSVYFQVLIPFWFQIFNSGSMLVPKFEFVFHVGSMSIPLSSILVPFGPLRHRPAPENCTFSA